jgi:hypothetical protein
MIRILNKMKKFRKVSILVELYLGLKRLRNNKIGILLRLVYKILVRIVKMKICKRNKMKKINKQRIIVHKVIPRVSVFG